MLELAAHLEGKAAQLRWKGFGKIKITLAGTDTSSLLKILEGCLGYVDLVTSQSTASTEKVEKEVEEEVSTPSKQIPATLSSDGGLANAELVLPLKYTPTVAAGLPEAYLQIHGPETLPQHCCQFLSCSLEFAEKAAACNHLCHDHLNVALALNAAPKCNGIVHPLGNTIPKLTPK